jgi:hypothetical protein
MPEIEASKVKSRRLIPGLLLVTPTSDLDREGPHDAIIQYRAPDGHSRTATSASWLSVQIGMASIVTLIAGAGRQ